MDVREVAVRIIRDSEDRRFVARHFVEQAFRTATEFVKLADQHDAHECEAAIEVLRNMPHNKLHPEYAAQRSFEVAKAFLDYAEQSDDELDSQDSQEPVEEVAETPAPEQENEPDGTPVDFLSVDDATLEILKRNGIATVEQAEGLPGGLRTLKDVGPGREKQIQQAIADFRAGE